jgi:hypothetical protein
MGSVLLWGYPMYLLRVLLYHYSFAVIDVWALMHTTFLLLFLSLVFSVTIFLTVLIKLLVYGTIFVFITRTTNLVDLPRFSFYVVLHLFVILYSPFYNICYIWMAHINKHFYMLSYLITCLLLEYCNRS